MNNLELAEDSFDSSLAGNKLVVRLKARAMDILTDVETIFSFHKLLEAASEANNLNGYVQIKDSGWDSHADVDNLSQFIADDDELYMKDGRVYGFHHEVLMARFRNSLGYCLLALRNFSKPMVAGLQGHISAEYLGLTLLFDSRMAMSDTTISFDNVRTGIPPSPSVTLLMPGYIGTGKTLAFANQGEVITAQEALDLGLISRIIEGDSDLTGACINCAQELASNKLDIVEFNRQRILPSSKDLVAELEAYYHSVSKALACRRADRK